MKQAKTSSRLLALLLSLTLVIGMLPTTVFAETAWGGTGVAEVQKDPGSNTGICAMGNNLVLRDGSNGGLTQVYYADASGNIVGAPIDLSTMGLGITGDSAGGFDLKDIRLWATYTGRYNQDENAFANLEVVIWMQGGTFSNIITGNVNAQANSIIEQAQSQAQSIVDNAVADANNIRQSSIQYTDDMLKSLQTIINHSMEGAQSRFDAFMNSMKSSYDIVSSNRKELSAGVITEKEEENAEA